MHWWPMTWPRYWRKDLGQDHTSRIETLHSLRTFHSKVSLFLTIILIHIAMNDIFHSNKISWYSSRVRDFMRASIYVLVCSHLLHYNHRSVPAISVNTLERRGVWGTYFHVDCSRITETASSWSHVGKCTIMIKINFDQIYNKCMLFIFLLTSSKLQRYMFLSCPTMCHSVVMRITCSEWNVCTSKELI